jgi:hypothetical protein
MVIEDMRESVRFLKRKIDRHFTEEHRPVGTQKS